MTIIGIVGSEAAKFTLKGKEEAKSIINELISRPETIEVVSGGCHLGGVDIWTAEIGRQQGKLVTEFIPKTLSWETGYKIRNLQIAKHSDIVYCITVARLPLNYTGMCFSFCYHCNTNSHIKSGGCWTMHKAKIGILNVVKNEE